jgi:Subtilase family
MPLPIQVNQSGAIQRATGRGVKVAVIDSGINTYHSHVRPVAGGVSITCGNMGAIAFGDDYRDCHGHGTAVAGIIRSKAPGVQLYGVKVLHWNLRTKSRILAGAIRSCVANHVRVVNMSLGTSQISDLDGLREACEAAARRNMILVAAGGEEQVFPAYFPCVIGARADSRFGWDEYGYTPNSEIEFCAHAWPRPLPGLHQEDNLQGHSMAAAHITGLVARIIEVYPLADVDLVRNLLIQECARRVSACCHHVDPVSL